MEPQRRLTWIKRLTQQAKRQPLAGERQGASICDQADTKKSPEGFATLRA